MRMETAATLILCKVLNPDFPLHKAIIDQSQPEDGQEGSSDQNIPPVAASNEVSSNRVGIKRERTANSPGAHKAIKREPAGVFGKPDADEDDALTSHELRSCLNGSNSRSTAQHLAFTMCT